MKKTVYSLLLSDEVVREVDRLAHRLGTSRSALINQILAEYVALTTPERRVGEIFRAMEALLTPQRELIPYIAPNASSMSLKSSLEYKYRPTVKYEVELSKERGESIGTLSVNFRTQSAALLRELTAFFQLWKHLEETWLLPLMPGGGIAWALYEGKFVRVLSWPRQDCTAQELAQAISDYIRTFDELMKGYLAGRYTPQEVEARYRSALSRADILL